ncbi:MAG: hypothetical protein K2M13_04040 [Muribaculaceae bacterium]|nr:hypothetical protein [Muribaculaceae bacterium]
MNKDELLLRMARDLGDISQALRYLCEQLDRMERNRQISSFAKCSIIKEFDRFTKPCSDINDAIFELDALLK